MAGSTKNKIFTTGCVLMMTVFVGAFIAKPQVPYRERTLVDAYEVDQSEVGYLAATMWGEARDQGEKGMLAVGLVIMNRVGQRNNWHSVQDVVLSPRQFAVWDKTDPNYLKFLENKHRKEYKTALRLARSLLRNSYSDFTEGSQYYHSRKITPYWAKHMERTITVRDHIFYKEKTE
jgi:N-acetylmuramoyl-L-alanine amidase